MSNANNCKLEEGYTCMSNVADMIVSELGGRASFDFSTNEVSVSTNAVDKLNLTEIHRDIEQLKQTCGNVACKYNIDYKGE